MERMETPRTATPAPIPTLAEFIVKTPGVCGGEPRLIGTRIKVQHIYTWVEQMGMTPAQVVAEHPHLSMAQIHAALAYYWSHQDEIRQDMEAEAKQAAAPKSRTGPSRLQERLAEWDARDNPPPPA